MEKAANVCYWGGVGSGEGARNYGWREGFRMLEGDANVNIITELSLLGGRLLNMGLVWFPVHTHRGDLQSKRVRKQWAHGGDESMGKIDLADRH